MAVMGFNPAMEMSQLRTQQSLAMQGPAAAQQVPASAAAAQQMTLAAAAPGAAGEAAVGAAGVQPEPPQTSKILLQGILKGAISGASMALGLKQFGPLLMNVPFIGKLVGAFPSVGPPPVLGAGVLGFISKIPLVGGLVGKALPLLGKSGLAGFAIAALAGAAVGAIFGGIGAMKKAKTAAAEYAQAMAQQPPVGEPGPAAPATPQDPGAGAAPPVPKGTKSNPVMKSGGRRAKTWIIAKSGATAAPNNTSYGTYVVKKGDTVASLARRFHTTAAEIRRLNASASLAGASEVHAGTKLKLRRRVVD